MKSSVVLVDAFVEGAFRGNPAAVCLLDAPAQESWMQELARELNLAETAFLVPRGAEFGLRWFTPTVEVELCGHATLASAHVLWSSGKLEPGALARFSTRSGALTARRRGAWIELDFPAESASAAAAPAGLLEGLGVRPRFVGRSRFDYLVEVEDESTVRALRPDLERLRAVEARGVIVTSRADGRFDFVSRFFAPRCGVDEDPVTGSAHCCLGPYWRERLGRDDFVALQASERGGVVRVGVRGSRVLLAGQAREHAD